MKKSQSLYSTLAFPKKQDKDTNKISRYRKSNSILYLEEIALHAARKRYPTVPYLAPRKYRDDTANGLTKCVIDFLKLEGLFCERSGNEGRVIDNRKQFTDVLGNLRTIGNIQRIKSSGMKGASDLKSIIQGRFVAIEIKCAATRDRQSESQRMYQWEVEKSGGIYILVPDFESFLNWYQKFTLWQKLST